MEAEMACNVRSLEKMVEHGGFAWCVCFDRLEELSCESGSGND